MAPQEYNSMFSRLFPGNAGAQQDKHYPLKVRLVTWNMAEQRPKGDLSELFDFVPSETSPHVTPTNTSNGLPVFPLDAAHPYHIVVVGGQECPSSSNIPKAIGAGFKFIDKDKDKDAAKEKEMKPRNRSEKDLRKLTPERDDHAHEAVTGWTLMLEDWLCNGAGIAPTNPPASSSTSDVASQASKSKHFRPKTAHSMYQLHVKERLMGIYLAIFIHKDAKSLVHGTSKDAVTAGLIGGRLGNKGGVGISLNIAGSRILFLNCHLAAHEGKVHHRLANLTKIKAELEVDDFLPPDDPRKLLPDITEKFDFTFLFGDLNFRLDISRLHADWLISRQEYQKALAFDQLSNIMKNGIAFAGFTEAPINFAPTFKYDVLKTVKRSKSRKSQMSQIPVQGDVPELDIEAASIHSSLLSNGGGSDEHVSSDEEDDTSSPTSPAIAAVVVKAKSKWLGLVGSSPKKKDKSTPSWENDASLPSSPPTPSLKNPASSTTALPDNTLRATLQPSSSTSHKSSFESENDPEDDVKVVYDSSAKQRVPSWCDRILTKSTVRPEIDPLDQTSQQRNRSRVGSLLSALRLPVRSNRETHTKPATSEVAFDKSDLPLPPPSREPPENISSFSRLLTVTTMADIASQPTGEMINESSSHGSLRPPPTADLSLANADGSVLRRSVSASSLSPQPNQPRPRASTYAATPRKHSQTSGTAASRWRFVASLFTPHHHHHTSEPPQPPPETQPKQPPPQRGEIICLSYTTLSDRSMRNLEARSDHRPLIGCYALYI